MTGINIAFFGAALAVALPCTGSAIGVGTVGRAGAGAISVDPGTLSRALILQILLLDVETHMTLLLSWFARNLPRSVIRATGAIVPTSCLDRTAVTPST